MRPSTVRRMRLHVAQKLSLSGVIRPSVTGLLDPEIARRAAGAAIDRKDSAIGAQRRDEMVERNIMIAAIVRDLTQRHGFDEGQIAAVRRAPVEHRK